MNIVSLSPKVKGQFKPVGEAASYWRTQIELNM